jgi:hypothetical protein
MSAAALPQTARHAPAPGVSSPEREFLDCTGAVPLTIGDSVWNNNGDWPANVTQYGFPCYSPSQSLLGGEVVYEITIDGPECRAFGAAIPTSSCTHILYLLESCDEFDCLVSGTESIVTGCLDPGTYYLVVDGWVCYFELDTYDWTPVSHCCPILDACYTFDFSESNPGYTTLACDGAPVWEWGEPDAIPPVDCGDDPIVNVLGTNLDGAYPNNAGQVAIIGPIDITVDCACMELCHYYEIEEELDGGNVKVSTDGGSTWELLLEHSHRLLLRLGREHAGVRLVHQVGPHRRSGLARAAAKLGIDQGALPVTRPRITGTSESKTGTGCGPSPFLIGAIESLRRVPSPLAYLRSAAFRQNECPPAA